MSVSGQQAVDLGSIRSRRERLHAAAVDLEEASVTPAQDRDRWYARMVPAAERLVATLDAHVRDTEAPDGLYDSLVRDSEGRLQAAANRLKAEHPPLQEAARGVLDGARSGRDPEQLRDAVAELFRAISRHRHRGSDLLYEAYHVDIAPSD